MVSWSGKLATRNGSPSRRRTLQLTRRGQQSLFRLIRDSETIDHLLETMPVPRAISTFSRRVSTRQGLWLAAVVLLVVNDHIFKPWSDFPRPLAGILSDAAGLFVLPVVLCELLVAGNRSLARWIYAGVAVLFAGQELFPWVANAIIQLLGLVGWYWQLTPDIYDLLALPAVVASWHCFYPTPVETNIAAKAARVCISQRWALGGCLACLASGVDARGYEDAGDIVSGSAFLVNQSDLPMRVAYQGLRPGVELECSRVTAQLGRFITPEILQPVAERDIEPGEAIALDELDSQRADVPCRAVRITTPDGQFNLAWPSTTQRILPRQPTGSQLGPQPVAFIGFTAEGDYALTSNRQGDFLAPANDEKTDVPLQCEDQLLADRIGWDPRLSRDGEATLVSFSAGKDGCVSLQLQFSEQPKDSAAMQRFACLGSIPFPFVPGDLLTFSPIATSAIGTQGEVAGLQITRANDTETSLYLSTGQAVVDVPGLTFEVRGDTSCPYRVDALCGDVQRPVKLVAVGLGTSATLSPNSVSSQVRLSGGRVADVELAAGSELAVANSPCTADTHLHAGLQLEFAAWVHREGQVIQ